MHLAKPSATSSSLVYTTKLFSGKFKQRRGDIEEGRQMQAGLLPYKFMAICHPILSLFGERGVLFQRSEGLVPLSFIYLHFCPVLGELAVWKHRLKESLCSTTLSLPVSSISLWEIWRPEWWTAFICLWMGPFYCTLKTVWILKIMIFLNVSLTTQKTHTSSLSIHLFVCFFSIFLWGEDDSGCATFPDKT